MKNIMTKIKETISKEQVTSVRDIKVKKINKVMWANEFSKNELDILISCNLNVNYEEILDIDDYYSDGYPFISVYVELDKDSYLIQLCDCYNDMKYSFTEKELEKIELIARNYVKENYNVKVVK